MNEYLLHTNECAWIKELKVGDKVIILVGGYTNRSYVSVVDRITPKGFIGVAGSLYTEGGYVRGGGRSWLKQATKEALEEVEHESAVDNCLKAMNGIMREPKN